eukprot:4594367-Alexandrium_andersonii.AAC.1
MASAWQPCRKGKAKWSEDLVRATAEAIVKGLPKKAKEVLLSGNFKGGSVIALKDELGWSISDAGL